jgi:hypothetical protein
MKQLLDLAIGAATLPVWIAVLAWTSYTTRAPISRRPLPSPGRR